MLGHLFIYLCMYVWRYCYVTMKIIRASNSHCTLWSCLSPPRVWCINNIFNVRPNCSLSWNIGRTSEGNSWFFRSFMSTYTRVKRSNCHYNSYILMPTQQFIHLILSSYFSDTF